MTNFRKPSGLHLLFLVLIGVTAIACKPTPTPKATAPPASTPQGCHGELYVERSVVAKVTPQPKLTYQTGKSYQWKATPYGVEVTGKGKGILQVFDSLNKLLSKFNIYAADPISGKFAVKEWNGLKTITFNAGNFYIQDKGGQKQCKLNLLAGGVGISSVSTDYVITVRPDIDEVTVAILDGAVSVTSRGETVTLDAQVPDEQMVVVSNGIIGPLLPVPDPGRLLDDVTNGGDITPEIPQVPTSISLWADDRLLPILEELGARYTEDTGVEVLIQGMPQNEMTDRLFAAMEAGNAPDLLTVPHDQLFGLVENGLLLPAEPGVNPDLFVPGTIQAFSVNGVIYGAPYVYLNLALVVNPAFEIQIPPTWSEMSQMTAEMAFGREFFTGLMIPTDGYYFYPVQSAFGGYVFGINPDGSYNPQDIGLDRQGSLAAAAWLEEMVNSQPVFTGNLDDAMRNFQGGNAAMILTGPWSLPLLREAGTNYQIYPFPHEVQESQPFLSVDGFVISSASRAPEYAQDFIAGYLTSPDVMLAYSNFLGVPPARRDVLEMVEDPDVRAFGLAGMSGVPIPNIPEMQVVWGPWASAVQAVMSGELSGEEAFTQAADQVRQSLDQ